MKWARECNVGVVPGGCAAIAIKLESESSDSRHMPVPSTDLDLPQVCRRLMYMVTSLSCEVDSPWSKCGMSASPSTRYKSTRQKTTDCGSSSQGQREG